MREDVAPHGCTPLFHRGGVAEITVNAAHDTLLKGTDPASDQRELNRRIEEFYDRNADLYDFYQWYFYDWYQQRAWWSEVLWTVKRVRPKPARVLDLGCGTGNLALKFVQSGADVVGVDISRRVLEILKLKAGTFRTGRMNTVVADSLDFVTSVKQPFDVVCESSLLHHIFAYEDLVRAMARAVRPGGFLFLTREPLGPQELEPISRARAAVSERLERLYGYLFMRMVHARFFSYMVMPPDLSRISANFYESGISLARIRAVAAEEGLQEVRFRRWNERQTGILSYLDNRLLRRFRRERFQKSFYSVILQRPKPS
jgi:SAM-dependent methyltransferase